MSRFYLDIRAEAPRSNEINLTFLLNTNSTPKKKKISWKCTRVKICREMACAPENSENELNLDLVKYSIM